MVVAWNTNQQFKSLAKQIVLSDKCYRFAPKFGDTKLQRCHGALQILNNAWVEAVPYAA